MSSRWHSMDRAALILTMAKTAHCPALRGIIEQSISKVAEILHLPHMATPQLGFICNGLICDITEDRHICTLTKRTHEVSCGVDTDIVNEERKLCWLPQDISQSGKIFILISKIMPLKQERIINKSVPGVDIGFSYRGGGIV